MVDGRQNALLTDGQRRFLQSDRSGYSRQQQHKYREGIKDRVRCGIGDFTLLVEEMPDEWFEDIFGYKDDPEDALPDEQEVRRGIRSALQFLYTGTEEYSMHASFKMLVEAAATLAEMNKEQNRSPDPTFEMNYQARGGFNKSTIEKLKEGQIEDITVSELYSFLRMYTESPAFDPNDALEYSLYKYGTSKQPPGEYDPDYRTEDS